MKNFEYFGKKNANVSKSESPIIINSKRVKKYIYVGTDEIIVLRNKKKPEITLPKIKIKYIYLIIL